MNNSRNMVEAMSSWGETRMEDFSPPDSCCGIRSGQPRWREPGESEIHCNHFVGSAPDRYVCHPIAAHGTTLGVVYIEFADEAGVEAVRHRMGGLRQLIQITGMAIATLNLQIKLENQSLRDSLTGLFNRRFLEISLERELARAARKNQVLAIFMIDVDHFKRFNDANGHGAGDAALKAIAKILQSTPRASDTACRYGGEEFTIMLPESTVDGAMQRAESIRRAVQNLQVPFGAQVYTDFSVSVGVAFFPDDGKTAETLLHRADQALYHAKKNGRNQVRSFDRALEGDRDESVSSLA
jgi:diguanylate cyclase (GGDEF)-like protein